MGLIKVIVVLDFEDISLVTNDTIITFWRTGKMYFY